MEILAGQVAGLERVLECMALKAHLEGLVLVEVAKCSNPNVLSVVELSSLGKLGVFSGRPMT